MKIHNLLVLSIFLIITACNSNETEYVQTTHDIHTNVKALDTLTSPELKAPDFTLINMEGEKFQLSDQLGKVVVLNHWATWCGYCIQETPDFIEMSEELKDMGVLFVGISPEEWSEIKPFAEEYGISYPLLKDDGTFKKAYHPGLYPTTYVINRHGELAHVIKTATTTELLKPLLIELARNKNAK